MKRQFFIIGGIVVVIILVATVLSIRYTESPERLQNTPYEIESVLFNKNPITNLLELSSFAFYADNEMTLPRMSTKQVNSTMKYSIWKYERIDFFNGRILIDDRVQNFFTGAYEIEILEHQHPQLIRLYSDSIEFYLREQYFTLENPTIKLDF